MVRKKKVYFILQTLSGGGSEKVNITLANNLDKNIYDISIVLINKTGEFLKDVSEQINIIDLNISLSMRILSIPLLMRLFYKTKPDYVFSNLGYLNAILGIIIPLWRKKIKFIARESNILSKKGYGYIGNFLFRLFYKNFDKIVAQSNDMSNDLIYNYKIPSNKVIIINNPINFYAINDKLKEELKFSIKGHFKIFAIGRLRAAKGFDKLLIALSKINIEYHLTILGQGEEEISLKRLATQLKIRSNVSFIGFKKNPYKYMKEADLVILSSLYEGFPNVVLEAMACGTPVLANNCPGGVNEIIIPGINGEICNIDNEEDFKVKLNKILLGEYNPEQIKTSVESRYNLNLILKKYQTLFENLK